MKTAMQELIEYLNGDTYAGICDIKDRAEELIEKEKEQIVKDWQKGYSTGCVVGSNDYTNEDEEKDNGNYYYNQTYNQNQHIIDIMKADEDDEMFDTDSDKKH
jgi:uncharacterized protein YecA (UPF0149 family)